LNYQQLRSFVVPWPSDAERNRIAKRLVAIENQLSNEETLLAKLSLHKSGLMQDLLTGKVRVKVDEADEVAAHA
jgi:type I restriction enzyme S subunit